MGELILLSVSTLFQVNKTGTVPAVDVGLTCSWWARINKPTVRMCQAAGGAQRKIKLG